MFKHQSSFLWEVVNVPSLSVFKRQSDLIMIFNSGQPWSCQTFEQDDDFRSLPTETVYSSLVYSIPYQLAVIQFYVEMGSKQNFRCEYCWVVRWFKRDVEITSLVTPVERVSPFGSEHSDAKAGLQSGLCDLFKSSQRREKLYHSE